jgi:hypothetical protein
LTKLGVASYRERPAYSNEARLVRAIPTILSAVLLAAHFLRDGQIFVVVLCLLLPLLLIPRKLALLRLLQGLLVIGALEWLRTLWTMVQVRQAMDEPWTHLALILGVVAAFTLATAYSNDANHLS